MKQYSREVIFLGADLLRRGLRVELDTVEELARLAKQIYKLNMQTWNTGVVSPGLLAPLDDWHWSIGFLVR